MVYRRVFVVDLFLACGEETERGGQEESMEDR